MKRWFPFPWGKTGESEEELLDIDRFVESLKVTPEGFMEEEDVTYVKGVDLHTESAVDEAKKEFQKGNIVLIDLSKCLGSYPDAYNKIKDLRKYCVSCGGDICRISEYKLLVLPAGIEVVYSKDEPEE
ncbi:MAG: cell division protein SepF [Candidatus Altiarchaeota archaeon]|nr:cell division protein SepF [Candidatus Altiarchaeota archaeon]